MSKANSPSGPDAEREVTGVIERVIADVPAPHTRPVPDPGRETDRIAQRAARHAAMLSGSLALPPGPLGMLTVLPDLGGHIYSCLDKRTGQSIGVDFEYRQDLLLPFIAQRFDGTPRLIEIFR